MLLCITAVQHSPAVVRAEEGSVLELTGSRQPGALTQAAGSAASHLLLTKEQQMHEKETYTAHSS